MSPKASNYSDTSARVSAFTFVTFTLPLVVHPFFAWTCAICSICCDSLGFNYASHILCLWTSFYQLCIYIYLYLINQGFPGERCKCNILKSDIIAKINSHRLGCIWYSWWFGTKGEPTYFKFLSFLEGRLVQGRNSGLRVRAPDILRQFCLLPAVTLWAHHSPPCLSIVS